MGSTEGRQRYVAFVPPEPRPSRHELNVQLGPRSWRLTVYEADVAIVRVPHTDADEARRRLEDVGAFPLTTSGTIRAAKRRAKAAIEQQAGPDADPQPDEQPERRVKVHASVIEA